MARCDFMTLPTGVTLPWRVDKAASGGNASARGARASRRRPGDASLAGAFIRLQPRDQMVAPRPTTA